jgi:hypothetical protein
MVVKHNSPVGYASDITVLVEGAIRLIDEMLADVGDDDAAKTALLKDRGRFKLIDEQALLVLRD